MAIFSNSSVFYSLVLHVERDSLPIVAVKLPIRSQRAFSAFSRHELPVKILIPTFNHVRMRVSEEQSLSPLSAPTELHQKCFMQSLHSTAYKWQLDVLIDEFSR